jgi:hypothetical protein
VIKMPIKVSTPVHMRPAKCRHAISKVFVPHQPVNNCVAETPYAAQSIDRGAATDDLRGLTTLNAVT